MTLLAPILQSFFTDRLSRQRQASPNTISAYRDTFRLLLQYATTRTGKAASTLQLNDIDATCVAGFLDHLEQEHGNTARTRNARLAAIRSMFAYAALRCPESAEVIQRALAIPSVRLQRNLVTYLDNEETAAFLTACDKTSRTGRRDHAMFTLAIQTGLRVSELTSLTLTDLHLGPGPNIHCLGKGRKERRTPLVPDTVAVLTRWLHEQPDHDPGRFLFTTSTGRRLSPDAVQQRVTQTAARASQSCMPLRDKHVTVHTLRHTAAMRLLHAGVDITVIALWLGHEHITTTNAYLHADMTHKQEAIARAETLGQATTMERYQPTDALLRFLDNL